MLQHVARGQLSTYRQFGPAMVEAVGKELSPEQAATVNAKWVSDAALVTFPSSGVDSCKTILERHGKSGP
jgi:hypothetical protein